MRLERMAHNKFKIFLTFDDLEERGLTESELWHDVSKVQQLFHDMMFEASYELGFELEGMLQIKVHLLQAQGMLVVVTQDDFVDDDDYVEMKVTFDESKEMMFSFSSFEEIIQVSSQLNDHGVMGGTVYVMDNKYYMKIHEVDLVYQNREHIIAIMSEFSSPSTITSHRLIEYGKILMKRNAVEQIMHYFYK